VDEELIGIAKTVIDAEYELTAAQAARFRGETVTDLRADATPGARADHERLREGVPRRCGERRREPGIPGRAGAVIV
jgi:hypothetical protein